jgi:hypothetical protein
MALQNPSGNPNIQGDVTQKTDQAIQAMYRTIQSLHARVTALETAGFVTKSSMPTTSVSTPNAYIATETGANNAIAGDLKDSSGTAIALTPGLTFAIKLSHTLQIGANTLALNGGAKIAIKKHTNPASNLSTAYNVGSLVNFMYDGTVFQDLSQ